MKRVLVTGAAGFIGRHSLGQLRERGYEVHGTWLTSRPNQVDGIQWHRVDLLNPTAVEKITNEVKPTHLLHFAWYAVPRDYRESCENVRWCEAGLRLLRAFATSGGTRAVFAGSCFEYDLRYGCCVEDFTPERASNLYGVCKNSLRQVVLEFAKRCGLSTAWGRIFYLYGPGEAPERLVPSVTLSILRGEYARCTHGGQLRDFLHVEDVTSAFAAVLDSETVGTINIGSGEPTTIRAVVSRIAEALEAPDRVEFGAIEAGPTDPAMVIANISRLRDEVGWRPRWTLDEGLRATIGWWKAHERSLIDEAAMRR
jgi:nucleoside-diphosphate-sugar epimerase